MSKSTFHTENSATLPGIVEVIPRRGVVATVLKLVNRLKQNSQLNQLNQMDDGMLADIGISRGDVHWASRLPIDQSPTLALEALTKDRSRWRRQQGTRRPARP